MPRKPGRRGGCHHTRRSRHLREDGRARADWVAASGGACAGPRRLLGHLSRGAPGDAVVVEIVGHDGVGKDALRLVKDLPVCIAARDVDQDELSDIRGHRQLGGLGCGEAPKSRRYLLLPRGQGALAPAGWGERPRRLFPGDCVAGRRLSAGGTCSGWGQAALSPATLWVFRNPKGLDLTVTSEWQALWAQSGAWHFPQCQAPLCSPGRAPHRSALRNHSLPDRLRALTG